MRVHSSITSSSCKGGGVCSVKEENFADFNINKNKVASPFFEVLSARSLSHTGDWKWEPTRRMLVRLTQEVNGSRRQIRGNRPCILIPETFPRY